MDRSDHLEELKQRAERLKHEYRILWTYYQMAQSLLRTLLKVRRLEDLGLDQIYERLRELEQSIEQATDPIPLIRPFQEIEQRLQHAQYLLTQFDNNISPAVLRRFIERLEDYDPRFLIYLIMFILSKYPLSQDDWDKVDLLLTKLCIVQTGPDQFELRPERDLLHIQRAITRYYELPPAPPERVREVNAEIQAIASEVRRVTGYNDLLEWGLLARIREFKKSLQHLILHPQVMIPYLRLNLTTKRKFQVLYQQEIDRIHASLQEIGDSDQLELTTISPYVGGAEKGISRVPFDAIASEDFAQLLNQMASRMDDLTKKLDTLTYMNSPAEPLESEIEKPRSDLVHPVILAEPDKLSIPEVLAETFDKLNRDFERVNWNTSLQQLTMTPPIDRYRLEPFEVEAYQMGFVRPDTNPIERYLFRLIFIAAVSRIRMSNMAMDLVRRQRENPERWVQQVSPGEVARVQAVLTVAEDYERQLEQWQRYPDLPELLARRLHRSLRKLQRARVGLSLLKEQLEDEWSLIQGEMPHLPSSPLQVVQVRFHTDTSRFDNLFSWLGWISALAMFILMLIFLLTH